MPARRIPPVLDNALGFNLYRVALLFRNELKRALAEYGMTPAQWQVMQALWSTDDALNQNDIAHLTLRDKHTVSRILARLERDGWIVRSTDADDARAFIVEPTNEALKLRTEVPEKLYAHFEDILSALDDEEHERLLYLLKKLRHRLRDRD